MNKRIFSLFLALVLALSLCACGDKGTEAPNADTSASSSASQGSTISGTVDEVKDFMFVLDAEDGCFYSFDTASIPADAQVPAVGDKVTITYEGELSEVDNFNGTILSVEVIE